jgi:hypothetical protein
METVRLISWREPDGVARAVELRELGFDVHFEPLDPGKLLAALKEAPPAALIIDLDRSPAQGRDLGVALRIHGSTRRVPLVFAGGPPQKVEGIKKVLPDAEYAPWTEAGEALKRALSSPVADPVVPESILAGYSGTPLPKKLGIKEGSRVLLVAVPEGFRETLGDLPADVTLTGRYSSGVDLILWFVRSRKDLESGL